MYQLTLLNVSIPTLFGGDKRHVVFEFLKQLENELVTLQKDR